ncbi:MAG: hypothetical protein RI942_1557 [Pseudomonadota bacterium]
MDAVGGVFRRDCLSERQSLERVSQPPPLAGRKPNRGVRVSWTGSIYKYRSLGNEPHATWVRLCESNRAGVEPDGDEPKRGVAWRGVACGYRGLVQLKGDKDSTKLGKNLLCYAPSSIPVCSYLDTTRSGTRIWINHGKGSSKPKPIQQPHCKINSTHKAIT